MSIYFVIMLLAGVTVVTRFAGPLIVNQLKDTPLLRQFLEAMSSGVLAAIVASQILQGAPRDWTAMAVAAAVMWTTRSAAFALVAAAAFAALWTAVI